MGSVTTHPASNSTSYTSIMIIAGTKTDKDWHASKPNLVNGDANVWRSAFNEFFMPRLNLRYLEPIKILQKNDTYQGVGFSILAIQCTLIEFLESTARGMNYRFLVKGQPLNQYEYSSSRGIFVDFLSKRQPFSKTFDAASAHDFYENVRCGLLHEARTKGGWIIKAELQNDVVADVQNRIVYRNNFQKALLSYIEDYGVTIETNKALQEAFVRKFDNLCA